MTNLSPARRRALVRSLSGWASAWAPRPGEPGTRPETWRALQAEGLLDPSTAIPGPEAPPILPAGLRALGLPDQVSGPEEALRAAVARLLPWRRPRLRFGDRKEAVSSDDPDDATGEPISWSSHPCALATISTESEDLWEACGGNPEEAWEAVMAWTERVGFPMEFSRRGQAHVAIHDPEDLSARLAWVDGEWREAPPGGWGSLVRR